MSFSYNQMKDKTFFFPSFNWPYLQTVWSAVNLKYNPYLLYIAFGLQIVYRSMKTTAAK